MTSFRKMLKCARVRPMIFVILRTHIIDSNHKIFCIRLCKVHWVGCRTIWDVEQVNGKVFDRYGPGFYYPEEDIYPLKKCILSGVTTWCPRNPGVIFDAFYGEDADIAPKRICRRGEWIERALEGADTPE